MAWRGQILIIAAVSSCFALTATPPGAQEAAPAEEGPYTQSPWWPYLSAHVGDETPPQIAGGPLQLTITQQEGPVTWILPGRRELDPTIFGTPDIPKATEPPPIGVPVEAREVLEDGRFVTASPTPASDQAAAIEGTFELRLRDLTATDAATTEDRVDLIATFTAPDGGGTYRIEVDAPLSHGWYSPTLGGVATNVLMHGVTRWENQIMPTFFAYATFWGLGEVYLDGELIAEDAFIHGMLTEGIRGEGYTMVTDENVDPGHVHFHLMGFPHNPKGEPNPIPTGFIPSGGQEQPFFHIMFETPTTEQGATF